MAFGSKEITTSMSGGVVDLQMRGRVDLNQYQVSFAEGDNFTVGKYGSISNRTGTGLIETAATNVGNHKLIPFGFNKTQTYQIELFDNGMRFLTDRSVINAPVIGESDKEWVDAGGDIWYVDTTLGGDPFVDATLPNNVYLDGVKTPTGTLPALAVGESFVGTYAPFYANDTIFIKLASGIDPNVEPDEYITTDYRIESGIPESAIPTARYTQSADSLFITGDFFPKVLQRFGEHDWRIQDVPFSTSLQAPYDLELENSLTGTARKVRYMISAITNPYKESLPSEQEFVEGPLVWDGTTDFVKLHWNFLVKSGIYSWVASGTGTGVFYCTLTGSGNIPTIANPGNVFLDGIDLEKADDVASMTEGQWFYGDADSLGEDTLYVRLAADADPDTLDDYAIKYREDGVDAYRVYKNFIGDWGWIGDASECFILDTGIEPLITIGPKVDADPFTSDDQDSFPNAVGFYKQRLHFGGSDDLPQTLLSSTIGDYTSFKKSNPISDADTINSTIATGSIDQIVHYRPMDDHMLIFTDGSEWSLRNGRNSDTLGPFSLRFQQHGDTGCSRLCEPLRIGKECLFVERGDRDVMSLRLSSEAGGYNSDIISYFATNIFKDKQIVSWAHTRFPDNVIWIVLDDGSMASITYISEQQMIAFCTHSTAGLFLDASSNTTSTTDDVYFIAERENGAGESSRYIEFLSDRNLDYLRDATFLDNHLVLDDSLDVVSIGDDPVNGYPLSILMSDYSSLSDGDYVHLSELSGIESTIDSGGYEELSERYYKLSVVGLYGHLLMVSGAEFEVGDITGSYVSGAIMRKCVTTVSGLDHMEGLLINLLADGQVLKDRLVTDGAVELGGQQFGYGKVVAGRPYTSRFESLPLAYEDGSGKLVQMKTSIDHIGITFSESVGGYVGLEDGDMQFIRWRDQELFLQPNEIDDRTIPPIAVTGGNEHSSTYIYEQPDPLPVTIQAFTVQYSEEDLL